MQTPVTRRAALGAGAVGGLSLMGLLEGCDSVPSTLKIGVAQPLTGNLAALGQDLLNGVNLAVKELNRDGFMVDGKRVQLEVVSVDDKAEQRYGAVGVYELRGGVWELRMRSDRW